MLGSFYAWLVDQRIKELEQLKKFENIRHKHSTSSTNTISWIEKLLQPPILDHRKFVV
jgi:hypothetical protein